MDLSAMLQRIVRAVTFDVKFYNEAENDTRLNTESLIVVAIVAVLSGLGAIGGSFNSTLGGVIGTIILGIVGYYALAYVAYLVGTNFFGGQGSIDKVMRPLGYAQAPNALSVLGIIPFCFGPIILVGAVWALACTFVAVRESLELDTTKAAVTTAAAFVVWGILRGLLIWIF